MLDWPGPMTHRQFKVWCAWEDLEWNKPNRSDHYTMQVAYQLAVVNSKNPSAIRFDKFKIKFSSSKNEESDMSLEKAAALAKMRWIGGLFGGKVEGFDPKRDYAPLIKSKEESEEVEANENEQLENNISNSS